jgi:selenocysteine lyase/cysteine desulfurase
MERVEGVRALSARLVGAEKDEIAFIKNTSHGISIVTGGLDWKEGDNVLVFEKEFPSNIYPWLDLKRKGVEVRFIPLRDDRIRLDDIENLMDRRTRLVSMSSVQSLNGFMINLKELGALCRRKGVLFFVDAIQSLGVIPMDVRIRSGFLPLTATSGSLRLRGRAYHCSMGRASVMPNLIGGNRLRAITISRI